jgi:hypothetical protein
MRDAPWAATRESRPSSASPLGLPTSIASDGVYLYELMPSSDAGDGGFNDGFIVRIPVSGGSALSITHALGINGCLAVDETNVYWTDSLTGAPATVAKAGGIVTTLATSTTYPSEIALDATNVYWAAAPTYYDSITSVMRVSKAGGEPVTLLSGPLAAGAGGEIPCRMLAIEGGTLFLGEENQIVTFSATGVGDPTVIATANPPMALAVDSTNLFWVGVPVATVLDEMPLEGGPPVTLIPQMQGASDFVVATDGTLYWTTPASQVDSFAP